MERVHLGSGIPVTNEQIEAEHPGLMFGPGHDLAYLDYPWLVEVPPPSSLHTRGPNEFVDGRWRMTWVVPAPRPFAERQAELIRAVDQRAAGIRNDIVADISPAEMASWPIKRAEALAWQVSENANDAPNLAMEADARGCSLADLVARVLAKSVALSAIEAQIAGHTGKLQDQLRAVEEGDSAALAAIDITAGWLAV